MDSWIPGDQSPLAPGSPFAAAITHTFAVTLGVCAVIAFGVAAAIAYSLVVFRSRAEGGEPTQVAESPGLEVVWTVVPLAIVTGLFVLTLDTMARSDPLPVRAPDVTVVGHQWWWEFLFFFKQKTAYEIHIPAGRPLLLR